MILASDKAEGTFNGECIDSGVNVVCCVDEMERLWPGTSDGAAEKHVPVYLVKEGQAVVAVGSAIHPSTEDHYIEWVAIQTNLGNQRKELKPGGQADCGVCSVGGRED